MRGILVKLADMGLVASMVCDVAVLQIGKRY